jgi:phage major head subunit gpT-like protein
MDTVIDETFGREHEHGRFAVAAAQFTAERVTIEFRHHDIEQDEVVLFGERAFETGRAIRGRADFVTLGLERFAKRSAHGKFVFDDEEAHGVNSVSVISDQ